MQCNESNERHLSDCSNERQGDHREAGWYPGKNLKKLAGKVEQLKTGELQPSYRPLIRLRNRWKKKRELSHREGEKVATVRVSVLEARALSTPRPYVIVAADGNEERTKTAMNASPSWADAMYEFPIFEPTADVCIFLFDDRTLKNETCIGRVIVPLRQLCAPPLFLHAQPQQTNWFGIQPATKQGGVGAQELFEEAVPGVPGSGMVRPAAGLGFIRLQFELILCPQHQGLGMISSFASADLDQHADQGEECSDGGESGDDDDGALTAEEPAEQAADGTPPKQKLAPRVMKQNVRRLQRVFGAPYLCRRPYCFALLPLHALVAFHLPLWSLPLVVWCLLLANGVLGHIHSADRTGGTQESRDNCREV
jgi:hypothetical protein